MIKIVHCKNEKEVAVKSAEMVKDVVKANPWAVLGLATGSSPVGMYTELANAYKNGDVSFKNVKTVNLDEYVGLGEESDQSYVYFMRSNLFDGLDIDIKNKAIRKIIITTNNTAPHILNNLAANP